MEFRAIIHAEHCSHVNIFVLRCVVKNTHTQVCRMKTQKTLICKHKIVVACFENIENKVCQQKCGTV